eukprot:10581475-Heterocapsa_arctica.AAC.1
MASPAAADTGDFSFKVPTSSKPTEKTVMPSLAISLAHADHNIRIVSAELATNRPALQCVGHLGIP